MASGLGFRPSDLSFFSRKFASPINHRENVRLPFTPLRKMNPEQPMRWGSGCCLVVAAKRPPIDGVPAELNKIASQKLDSAPARRRVRSAFIEIQQQLDHCLFKVWFVHFSTFWSLGFSVLILCFFFLLILCFGWVIWSVRWLLLGSALRRLEILF